QKTGMAKRIMKHPPRPAGGWSKGTTEMALASGRKKSARAAVGTAGGPAMIDRDEIEFTRPALRVLFQNTDHRAAQLLLGETCQASGVPQQSREHGVPRPCDTPPRARRWPLRLFHPPRTPYNRPSIRQLRFRVLRGWVLPRGPRQKSSYPDGLPPFRPAPATHRGTMRA